MFMLNSKRLVAHLLVLLYTYICKPNALLNKHYLSKSEGHACAWTGPWRGSLAGQACRTARSAGGEPCSTGLHGPVVTYLVEIFGKTAISA